MKIKNPITFGFLSLWFRKKMVPPLTQFFGIFIPPFYQEKEKGLETIYLHLKIYEIIFVFFSGVFVGPFWCFFNVFNAVCHVGCGFCEDVWVNTRQEIFWKILLLHKEWQTNRNSANQTSLQSYSVSGRSRCLGGLHTLVVRKQSPRSVLSDMVLY